MLRQANHGTAERKDKEEAADRAIMTNRDTPGKVGFKWLKYKVAFLPGPSKVQKPLLSAFLGVALKRL